MTWKVCLMFAVLGCTYGKNVPIVNTKIGAIRGLQAEDGDYAMYLGIPYADIDKNKPFGDSTPHPPFESTFDAYDDSAKCPQQHEISKKIEGQLDCLHLNIYVPNKFEFNKTLPVLVWIHGGGFVQGDFSRFFYGPKYLMRHDIVLVTLNYRVGPYGFLCLDTPEAPGNQGAKDQVLALRWIKNNVEAFGGNSDQITAMGESVGAVSVELHILSKFEKLFDAAILQSGTLYMKDSITTIESNTRKTFELSERLGFKTNDTNEVLSFLSKMNPQKLVKAFFELNYTYAICIEKTFENITPTITEHPDYLTVSKDKLVPILGGFNNREDLTTYKDQKEKFLSKNFIRDYLESLFHVDDEMVDIVHRYYLGDDKISEDVKENLIDFSSDFRRNHPMQKSLLRFKKEGGLVYQYMFSYSGTRNDVKNRLKVTDVGATHADEISYIFDLSYDKHATQEDQLIIDRMTTLWTNFVKYRNPTPEITELIPVKWTPMTEKKVFYLDINVELSMKTRPFHSRMAFWDLFFKTYEHKKLSYRN